MGYCIEWQNYTDWHMNIKFYPDWVKSLNH